MIALALAHPVVATLAPSVIAVAGPKWVWAALFMAGFVALTIITMALARIPTRVVPPPVAPSAQPRGAPAGRRKRGRDWEVARVAPDQLTAEMWVQLLQQAGVPAQVSPSDAVSYLGTSGLGCRVLVPKERLEDAEALLDERVDTSRNGGEV